MFAPLAHHAGVADAGKVGNLGALHIRPLECGLSLLPSTLGGLVDMTLSFMGATYQRLSSMVDKL